MAATAPPRSSPARPSATHCVGPLPLVPRRRSRASPLPSAARWQRGRHCRCGTGGRTTTKNRGSESTTHEGGDAIAGLGVSGSRWVRLAARRHRRGRPSTWSSPSTRPLLRRTPRRSPARPAPARAARRLSPAATVAARTTLPLRRTLRDSNKEQGGAGEPCPLVRPPRGCRAQRGGGPRRRRFHLVTPVARPPRPRRRGPGRGPLVPPSPRAARRLFHPRAGGGFATRMAPTMRGRPVASNKPKTKEKKRG